MADERYQWLDQEAAERLLRGEPVDALDDPARPEARRLAEALDSARTPAAARTGQAELPGEAAALAAFRRATAERAASAGAAATPAGVGRVGHADLGRVRLAPVTAPARRWGRSLRYGLAAAVAAVTVGGVAVAAGTGMLPLMGPEPAASVTAVETPDPVETRSPGIQKDPEAPPVGPDGVDQSPGSSPAPGASSSAGSSSSPASPSHSASPDPRKTPDPGRTTPRPGGDTGTAGVLEKEKALKACRDYRSGRLGEADRRQLTNTLRGGETLRRYCDRILGTSASSGGTGGAGGTGGTGEPREGGKDEGQDDGASDGARGGSSGDGSRADGSAAGSAGKGESDRRDATYDRRNSGSEAVDEDSRGTSPAAGVTLSGPSAQY
ncbi:hypothetical protein ACWFR1_35795 [Streptomyces sp. NPDC055103]